jgi:hypothetical protein
MAVPHHEQRLPTVGGHRWHSKGLPDGCTNYKQQSRRGSAKLTLFNAYGLQITGVTLSSGAAFRRGAEPSMLFRSRVPSLSLG